MLKALRFPAFLIAALFSLPIGSAAGAPNELRPLDPVVAVVSAFKSHRVVVLGEGDHGNVQGHQFRLSLVRDPKFARIVNDIVVEIGSAQFQDVMDRYIDGEQVPFESLRKAWEDTSIAWTTWDVPIYREFFEAVRDVNRRLPPGRRLRVLLGDEPLDWNRVARWEDYRQHARTDDFPAALIEREVLAKNRRALVIYGDGHIVRKQLYWPLSDRAEAERRFAAPVNSLVTLLERSGERVYSIATLTSSELSELEPSVSKWRAPKLAKLSNSRLGSMPASALGANVRYVMVDKERGIEERVVADPNRSPTLQGQFDAVLYLGPKASITYSELTTDLCKDDEYLKRRARRMAIASPWDADPAATLMKRCAHTD